MHLAMSKEKLSEVLADIMQSARLVAPVKEQNRIVFREVRHVDEIEWTDEIPYMSPKEFLFPQLEKLMTFDIQGELHEHTEVCKTVVWGVKPCDLKTIRILKGVFSQGLFMDSYFAQHLEDTLFIGTACLSEKPGCFCGERGIDRTTAADCDVFVTDYGDYYDVTACSEAGREMTAIWPLEPLHHVEAAAMEAPPVHAVEERLRLHGDTHTIFENINWERIAERCLGCGICTYVCPTCHCFAFKDVREKGGTARFRTWDSCMYPKFTAHASGHNPRSSKTERIRQRIMHKYVYIPKNQGYTACTGCGRCIRSCPAGMDIRSVVSGIMEELS